MKTLNNHVILYDNECPMCKLYTGAFVQTRMLDKDGRQAFNKMDVGFRENIDVQRACDEIALVNTKTGQVIYGINSLFAILAHRFPMLTAIFRQQPVQYVMSKVYAFISYNRKVIAPASKFESPGSCTPVFNLSYRIAYLVFTLLTTSWVLHSYALLIGDTLPGGSIYREMLICAGQILFQGVIIFTLRRDRVMHYLGNMMTVSMMGALALLPAMLLAKFGVTNNLFFMGWFGLVVAGMLLEHARRVRLLEIHWSASLGWVVYRILVLVLIFSL